MEARDQQFRELMKSYKPEKAPVDFTKMVMEQIHLEKPVREYKPVFGKWFLRTAGAIFAAFIIYASFVTGPAAEGDKTNLVTSLFSRLPKTDLSGVANVGKGITGWMEQFPSVVVFVLFAATLLLILDWSIQHWRKTSAR